MMISRQWRGVAKPAEAQAYIEHLQRDTFPQIVTRWETMVAIRAFAGEDAETAVVPENVRRMMVEFDARVRHYEVVQG